MDQYHYPILSKIESPSDVKQLSEDQLPLLAAELRHYMIETTSRTGGHLASSLGAVEMIIAMHRVFDSPTDKLVFDVGHQAYAHKILTGRRDAFAGLRQEGGISGFPKHSESEHDAFDTGHASTAVSAAVGMARAKVITGDPGVAVALVGDGAMTGGMFFEALDDAGQKEIPLIVVLNDNGMSISKNVGSVRTRLSSMRLNRNYVRFKRYLVRELDTSRAGKWLSKHMDTMKTRIKNFLLPDLLFEEFGFVYLGPIDGHDIKNLEDVFRRAKEVRAPVIVHTITQKGKGYAFSEQDPEKFHGIAPFDMETGLVEGAVSKSNSDVFGDALTELAKKDRRIVAITAAMPSGTGLKDFSRVHPDRFFDVGIAEEHAVTMAAGMAACGLRPVVALYSSFLQRAFDQLLHDVCLQKLPVIIAVDRAGLVGADGETHQGIYDPVFLSSIPNLTVYSPATQQELVYMLNLAIERGEPACIRFNRGRLMQAVSSVPVRRGGWEVIRPIARWTIVAAGPMVEVALPVAKELDIGLINARTLRPLDEDILDRLAEQNGKVLVAEESIAYLYPLLSAKLQPLTVRGIHLPVEAIPQGSVKRQRAWYGLTAEKMKQIILEDR